MSLRAVGKVVGGKTLAGALLAGLVLLLALAVREPARGQSGGGVGTPGGTAAATIIIGDAVGVPGGSTAVTFSFTSEEGSAGTVTINMVFDETDLSLNPDDCVLSDRLGEQLDSVSFPPNQPAPPERRLRIGVFPPLDDPGATFADGDLMTCTFGVSADAAIGSQVDLVLEEPLQVVRGDLSVICGIDSEPPAECGAEDGVVMIEEATPTNTPTSTFTHTRPPTNTPTSTPTTSQPTNTPTNTPTGQATSTPTGEATDTPTNTPTRQATNTPTDTPTRQVTDTPTNTPTRQATNTPTTRPQQADSDDSCAIVPLEQSDPSRSLVLLLVPGLLLWARRRRF